ncbi:TonB-dependent receptor [Parahaliea sp. F7430]|uniref:TonB-dependent receptor n=1 Tax=Sediminihaliea albiluteola TaxID=2758564 RepID=A0A7W2TYB2_9GAMM|nr:TonB-dependent receptor [Sediminihaliea albiluteola]MBA6414204.1 TonB-dependent receptor [Sediminihaliea albiluteola]
MSRSVRNRFAGLGVPSLTALAVALGVNPVPTMAQGAMLEEVVVTARKRQEAIQDVPVSITAFSDTQLRDAGITNIKHLGYQVPGLQIDQASTAQIWIRGIGQRDDGARVDGPVGVYIDGLYMPRKDGQLLDLIDVQSLQVLRGPQGTLFGKNTTGGALIVTSKSPEAELSGFVEGRLGNLNRQDFRVGANVPLIDDKLLSRITLGSTQRDGYQKNIVTGQKASSEDRQSVALQLRWDSGDSWTADALAYYGEVREVQPATNCGPMTASSYNGEDSLYGNRILPGDTVGVDAFNDNDTPLRPGFVAKSPVGEAACLESNRLIRKRKFASEVPKLAYNVDNLLLGLTLEWELSDQLSLKSITGYSDQKVFGQPGNPDNDATALPLSGRYRKTGSDREHWSQELQLNGTAFDQRLSYTVGLFAMQEDIDDGTDTMSGLVTGSFIPADIAGANVMVINGPTAEDQTFWLENNTYAAFFQGSYAVTDNLELTAGVRWTSENRKQRVDVEILDEAAFYAKAFPALNGVPGVLLPIESAGVAIVDPNIIFAQDIFTKINNQFPPNSYNGMPAHQLLPANTYKADKTWEKVTPMVSLSYNLPESLLGDGPLDSGMVYVTYSEGFKSGTFEPVGNDGMQTVEPEEVDNIELGFKLDMFNNSMRLNGAVFRTNFDGMQLRQVQSDSQGIPRVILRNASSTRIQGVELEWTWTPLDGLLIMASGSLNDYDYLKFDEYQFSSVKLLTQQPLPLVDRSSEPFAEVPELSYNLAVQYSINSDWGTFTPRIDYSYVDEIFMGLDAGAGQNRDQATFDDYGLVNARLGWQSSDGRIEAAAYATNLTNERYFFGAAAVGDSTGAFQITVGPPRMYGIELRYNFF